MTKLEMYRDYCKMEFNDLKRAIESNLSDDSINPIHLRNCTLQRCLGVSDFLQLNEDISFDEIDEIYTEYRTKVYELTGGY